MPRPSPPTITRGAQTYRKNMRCSARPITSSRILAPPQRGRVAVSLSHGPTGPTRSVFARSPAQAGVCVLPVAAAVAAALAPPRPADVIFPWLAEEARRRDPHHHHPWVLLIMASRPCGRRRRDPGEAPRVEILDLLHAIGYLWEAVHLFACSRQRPGVEVDESADLGAVERDGHRGDPSAATPGRTKRAARCHPHPPGADSRLLSASPRPHSL